MSNTETTRRELKRHGITSITEGSALLLGTVTLPMPRMGSAPG